MSGSPARQESVKTKFAEGWYLVCWSADLAPGEVMPLQYFERDFVLFRGESGKPTLLDAHCPHLGAHLGYGGRVEGDEVVCPFHAWLRSRELGQQPGWSCSSTPEPTRPRKPAWHRQL